VQARQHHRQPAGGDQQPAALGDGEPPAKQRGEVAPLRAHRRQQRPGGAEAAAPRSRWTARSTLASASAPTSDASASLASSIASTTASGGVPAAAAAAPGAVPGAAAAPGATGVQAGAGPGSSAAGGSAAAPSEVRSCHSWSANRHSASSPPAELGQDHAHDHQPEKRTITSTVT
jgi:hypothetical protein